MRLIRLLFTALCLLFAITAQAQTLKITTANLQHGQGTDASFNFSRQITALAAQSPDLIAVQERSTTETGWNSPLSSAGYAEAVYWENDPSQGDGPAIWYKSATVTVHETYHTDLSNGFIGWNGSTNVDKAAVAARVTVQGRQFYIVNTHLCWSACANSSGSQFSTQRESQINTLLSWINSTLTGGLDVVIAGDMNFGPDYPKVGGGNIRDLFTANYTDLWAAGVTAGTATTPWGDRDADGTVDMTPADLGTQTTGTRTHDTRRIDYIFLKTGSGMTLASITVPDSRATCSVALEFSGTYKHCPDTNSSMRWDVTDDQGVRASDHNFMTVTLNVPSPTLPDPTNAPLAHPLAPNPHTSVGLFAIYLDPNTGRRATGLTYKWKRCTGAACTPTVVIASGLTYLDYQDTGLTVNTTYGYRYVANDGDDSADSPTTYVTTLAADSDMVQFPSTVWSNLLGPLVESSQIPYAYYRDTMTAQGQDVISKYPVVAPSGGSVGTGRLSGTGAINNGSTTLTGTGTFFLEQVAANNPACLDAISINGVNAGAIASVDSNTQITLVTPWAGSNVSGVNLTTNIAGLCGAGDPLGDYLTGNQLMYYDSAMALWQIYFMTGDPQYLRGAMQGSESLFAGWLHLGRNRDALGNLDSGVPPRNVQFSGLLLYGLAGHNGVWDQLDKYLSENYPRWISNYRGGSNSFQYPREKFYMLLYTAWFVMAAPDSFPRSNGTVTSLNGATTVDGDLTDGRKDFYRDQLDIDLPGFVTDDQLPWGMWVDAGGSNATADGDYPYVGGDIVGPAQPFIQGLGGDALGYCWRATALSSTARNAARKLVLRVSAAMGLLSYNTNQIPQDPSKRFRSIWYFYFGGNRLNPYAFQHGADSFVLNDTPYANAAPLNRQSIPLMLSTFGWAWEMSGHQWYKDIGDEMANAAFAAIGENTGGTGDGLKSLCDSDSNYKDFGQCFRTSARFFGHRTTSPGLLGTAPVVTMPANMTLTGGVNQAAIPTPSVTCTNTPCNYRWGLQEYPMINNPRYEVMPVFTDATALTTKLCGLESGTYKVVLYVLDALGMEGHGTMTITVGDGVFPPVAVIGYGNPSAEEQHQYFTTSSSLAGSSRAYSIAGRTVTHSFSATWPKDKSAPTITPANLTSNISTFTVSGLSAGLWTITDTITDSAGAVRKTYMYIRHTAESQPSVGHNTIPTVSAINQILPVGSTSTVVYVVPRDPEGIVGYSASATGYTTGELSGEVFLVTPLTHSWTQVVGPAAATLSATNTIKLGVDVLPQTGTYTFRYTGTDQQGDVVTVDVDVVVPSAPTSGTGTGMRGKATLRGRTTVKP